MRFLLLSIILTDVAGNRSSLQQVQKVMSMGCDRWISIHFVCFFFKRPLVVVVIMIDGSVNDPLIVGFWTSEWACHWKAQCVVQENIHIHWRNLANDPPPLQNFHIFCTHPGNISISETKNKPMLLSKMPNF